MSTTTIDGSSVPLTKGRRYRGIVRVSVAKPLVSERDISQKLEDVGFASVRVWKNRADLPADWPADMRKPDPSGIFDWFAFVEGVWSKPSAAAPRPAEIEFLWLDDPPIAPVVTPDAPPPGGFAPHTSAWARALLRSVWPTTVPGRDLTAAAELAILAIARLETGFARWDAGGGEGSNNFGAIQGPCGAKFGPEGCPPGQCGPSTFPHLDHHVDAKTGARTPYTGCYRTWPTPAEGMAGFVSFLMSRASIAAEIGSGDADAIAGGMKRAGYFEEFAANYAKAIASAAATTAKELGVANSVTRRGPAAAAGGLALFLLCVAGAAAAAHHWGLEIFDA